MATSACPWLRRPAASIEPPANAWQKRYRPSKTGQSVYSPMLSAGAGKDGEGRGEQGSQGPPQCSGPPTLLHLSRQRLAVLGRDAPQKVDVVVAVEAAELLGSREPGALQTRHGRADAIPHTTTDSAEVQLT